MCAVGEEWLSRNGTFFFQIGMFCPMCGIEIAFVWFRKCFFQNLCCCWSSLHSTVPTTCKQVLMKTCQMYSSLEFNIGLRNRRENSNYFLGGSSKVLFAFLEYLNIAYVMTSLLFLVIYYSDHSRCNYCKQMLFKKLCFCLPVWRNASCSHSTNKLRWFPFMLAICTAFAAVITLIMRVDYKLL